MLLKNTAIWRKTKDKEGHEHASDTGQFTSGGGGSGGGAKPADKPKTTAISKLAGAGNKVSAFAKQGVDKAKAIWNRLPEKPRKLIVKGFHKLEFTMRKGKELAQQAARERGLPENHVNRLGRVLGIIDLVGSFGAVAGIHSALHALGMSETVSIVGSKIGGNAIPFASMAYVAYSTARNPLATIRAAHKVLTGKTGGAAHKSAKGEKGDGSLVGDLLQRFDEAADGADWYEALLMAALDAGDDLTGAMKAADEAFEEHPDPSGEKSFVGWRKDKGPAHKPAGSPEGGQFTAGNGGTAAKEKPKPKNSLPKTNKNEGDSGDHQATPEEHAAAKKLARKKIKNVPVPPPEKVEKMRAALERAKVDPKARAGGDARGSAAARRQRRRNLFTEFGGDEKGYVVCHGTGIKLHWSADPKENPHGYPLLEQGKIFVAHQGGGYQMPNLLPESFAYNRSRNDKTLRKENME